MQVLTRTIRGLSVQQCEEEPVRIGTPRLHTNLPGILIKVRLAITTIVEILLSRAGAPGVTQLILI